MRLRSASHVAMATSTSLYVIREMPTINQMALLLCLDKRKPAVAGRALRGKVETTITSCTYSCDI